MPALSLQNISLKAGNFSLNNVSFDVEPGAYFILLGPSGAGKSLLLEMIAGFLSPSSGHILLDGEDIGQTPIQHRKVGLLFQDFAVFPHLTVFNNIAYPLRQTINTRTELQQQVLTLADELEISHLLKRYPKTLSGGEQQRVALARTLARKPRVLLLDEPLASLDVQLRGGIRALLRKLNRQGQTIMHVTHDFEEAAILGHRIAVVENNTIAQCGTHDEVFHHPRSAFVANFVGIRNFFGGELTFQRDSAVFTINGISIRIMTDQAAGSGYAVLRSEDIILSSEPFESSAANSFRGVITAIEPARLGYEITIDAGIPFIALISGESLVKLKLETGQRIFAGFKASAVRFVPG